MTGELVVTLAENESASGDLNATDADGLTDGSLFSISTPPTNGSASIDPTDGNWTYSPKPYYYGSDSFAVSVTDDFNASTTLSIDLNITEVIEYHAPVVETGEPGVDSAGTLSLSGSVLSDGGKALLEVGFLLSSTLDFNQSERLAANPGSASGEFTLSSSIGSARFVRAYASNEVGESLGQVMAIEAPSRNPHTARMRKAYPTVGCNPIGWEPSNLRTTVGFSTPDSVGSTPRTQAAMASGSGRRTKVGFGPRKASLPTSTIMEVQTGSICSLPENMA